MIHEEEDEDGMFRTTVYLPERVPPRHEATGRGQEHAHGRLLRDALEQVYKDDLATFAPPTRR